jgi:hypothetical protein
MFKPKHSTSISNGALNFRKKIIYLQVRFEVLMAISMNMAIFWDVAPYSQAVPTRLLRTTSKKTPISSHLLINKYILSFDRPFLKNIQSNHKDEHNFKMFTTLSCISIA